ncbi:MAG: HdaA/DnaA family protein [Burkholderiales bacterium]
MQQLPLAISPVPAPTFGNFIEGANAEALMRVRELAEGRLSETVLYLWGEAGSGRSHLLRAAATAAATDRELVVADDVQTLDEPAQIALFNAINRARESRGAVLAAGDAPPVRLALREDLRTRLGWGLVYQLKSLTDEDKARHLRAEAERRGLRLSDEVIRYLLNRLPRDLVSLNAALELLDQYSLSHQRHITLPLVREALKAD